jgi:uncharacterized protein (TIGR00369 family)
MSTTPNPAWDAVLSNFNRHLGMKILEWSEGAVTVAIDIQDWMRNRTGIVHGGVTATLIDAAAGYAGNFCPHAGRRRLSSTLALTTTFLAPGKGGRIVARARVRGGGRTIYGSTVEVTDDSGTVIAIGEGTFKYFKGSETSEGVPLESLPT